MRILFITTAFNGMAQRLWIDLDRLNHEVVVHIAEDYQKMIETTENYQPDLIVAPYLNTKIPKEIFEKYICLVVHPGIVGDRGASSLDWAILRGEINWGVTILQAVEKMDAGPIWSFQPFRMRTVSKAQLYRNEVTQAAAKGILEAILKVETNSLPITLNEYNANRKGSWNRKIKQKDLAFSWEEATNTILPKINAADSTPGVLGEILSEKFFLYGAHREGRLRGKPGTILSTRNEAVCIATGDAAIWITHMKATTPASIKLPSTIALGDLACELPADDLSPFDEIPYPTWREIRFEREGDVGYIYFDFYNGAMSARQCLSLRDTIIEAKSQKIKVIVLMGGQDVWSNGIHLNVIHHADDPANESWENINAIDDLILEIITSTDHFFISALQGNAGAGGVSLALASDKILARNGIVLNPHTKNMGLYGSEYWTYLLPNRIGIEKSIRFTEDCLPWGVAMAKEIGLIDDFHGETNEEFIQFVKSQAQKIVNLPYFDKLIKAKKFKRIKDERNKPLSKYREEELARMYKNFYEDDENYHYKRHCFVHKIPEANVPQNLFANRRKIYRKRKWESINYQQ